MRKQESQVLVPGSEQNCFGRECPVGPGSEAWSVHVDYLVNIAANVLEVME